MQEEKDLLQAVAETVTDKPKVEITIDAKNPGFWNRLFKRKLQRTFIVKPTTVSSMYILGGKTVLWQEELFEIIKQDPDNLPAIIGLIQANIRDVIFCTAVIIQNNGEQPARSLVKWLEDNTDALDLAQIIVPVLGSTYLQSFLNSIILLKGTSEVIKPKSKMSPKDPEEMIAPGA